MRARKLLLIGILAITGLALLLVLDPSHNSRRARRYPNRIDTVNAAPTSLTMLVTDTNLPLIVQHRLKLRGK